MRFAAFLAHKCPRLKVIPKKVNLDVGCVFFRKIVRSTFVEQGASQRARLFKAPSVGAGFGAPPGLVTPDYCLSLLLLALSRDAGMLSHITAVSLSLESTHTQGLLSQGGWG